MTVEKTKSKVVTRIWQAISSSGVSLSSIPKNQVEVLVDAIADGVLLAIDEAFDEAGLSYRQVSTADETALPQEHVLWEGRPFLSLVTFYRITSERVRIQRGLFSRDFEDIELIRIQDIDRTQGFGERMLNFGDVRILSSDPSHPDVTLYNVPDPEQVHEILRRAMLDARRRFRYSVQEEM